MKDLITRLQISIDPPFNTGKTQARTPIKTVYQTRTAATGPASADAAVRPFNPGSQCLDFFAGSGAFDARLPLMLTP